LKRKVKLKLALENFGMALNIFWTCQFRGAGDCEIVSLSCVSAETIVKCFLVTDSEVFVGTPFYSNKTNTIL